MHRGHATTPKRPFRLFDPGRISSQMISALLAWIMVMTSLPNYAATLPEARPVSHAGSPMQPFAAGPVDSVPPLGPHRESAGLTKRIAPIHDSRTSQRSAPQAGRGLALSAISSP